ARPGPARRARRPGGRRPRAGDRARRNVGRRRRGANRRPGPRRRERDLAQGGAATAADVRCLAVDRVTAGARGRQLGAADITESGAGRVSVAAWGERLAGNSDPFSVHRWAPPDRDVVGLVDCWPSHGPLARAHAPTVILL